VADHLQFSQTMNTVRYVFALHEDTDRESGGSPIPGVGHRCEYGDLSPCTRYAAQFACAQSRWLVVLTAPPISGRTEFIQQCRWEAIFSYPMFRQLEKPSGFKGWRPPDDGSQYRVSGKT
jgi:hypothetical protein